MLTKTESKIMKVIYKECVNRESLLVTPLDLINMSGDKNITLKTIDDIMCDLNFDGYFDLVYSDKHGEMVYCISLTEKGKGFERNRKVFKRNIVFRIGLTVALAFLSFIVGLILKAIF